MSNFGGILSIARNAISASQAAMQVASHNIANAETEGYSRQRTELVPRVPLLMPYGSLGTGVEIANVTRARDNALDFAFRRESAGAAASGLRAELLGRLEGVLNEPSDQGLSATLDAFWNAWADLANNPTSASARAVLRQQGNRVSAMFRTCATQLDDLTNGARSQLQDAVAQINQQLRAVAELNGQITAAESSGNQAPDLRDARDRVLDQLAALGVPRSEVQADGTIAVYLGNLSLVSQHAAKQLEVRGTATTLAIGVVGDPDTAMGATGTLAALMDFVNTDVTGFRTQLDGLARAIVHGVNEYHTSGWTAAGDALGGANWDPLLPPTGSRVDFFDPAGVTAASIGLSSAVLADVNVIAAGDVQNAPGNTAVALALSALRDSSGMAALETRLGANFATQIGFATGVSYSDYYNSAVADVGLSASQAKQAESVHGILASNAEQRRLNTSGVSLDEELTKMMQYQQAYVAATRVVNAVNEMADALLAMV